MSQKTTLSYLERIRFDPRLATGAIASYISNIRIVILLLLAIAVLGLASYFELPQRLNPEIQIPIVNVVTVLPGASPNDVEELVTVPLEDKLRGVTGLDTIASVSQENVSVITMQFASSVSREKARNDAKEAVDTVVDLPADAQESVVTAIDFENQPVWQFALTGDTDPVSLAAFSHTLQEELENLPEVDRVEVRGRETQIIAVDILPEKIASYGINPIVLSQLLKNLAASFPAGTVDTTRNSFSLKIDAATSSVADLRESIVSVGTISVPLGEIANVHERSIGSQASSYIANAENAGQRAVTFAVYRRNTADIVDTSASVTRLVGDKVEATQNRFRVQSIINTGDEINHQFTDLLGEFQSTMILIFVTLFLFLGLRQAVISLITVPLTFLSAFIFMRYTGMSINFLSLFAFLLSLGLLIDDTIVVVSAMTTYYKTKKFTPHETGLLVWRDTIVPIWSTTITTIWSFVPLLLASGIIGEFIKPIPVVVTVTMISSTAIAVLVTLPLMIVLLKPVIAARVIILMKIIGIIVLFIFLFTLINGNVFFVGIVLLYLLLGFLYWAMRTKIHTAVAKRIRKSSNFTDLQKQAARYASHGVINIDSFAKRYEAFIMRVLQSARARRAVLIIFISYCLLSLSLLPLGLIQNEFFPKVDADVVYVNMEMSTGTSVERNIEITRSYLDDFRTIEGVEFVVADVGAQLSAEMGNVTNSGNATLFTFHLPPKEERHKTSIEVADLLRERVKDEPIKLSVVEQSGGPPAGAEVQLKLAGDDLAVLNQFADQIVHYLENEPGVINIEKSIKPGTSALVFVPDMRALTRYNLGVEQIGLWLRTAVSGFTLDSVTYGTQTDTEQDVVFSFGMDRQTPESITRLVLPTQNGTIPLTALGSFTLTANPSLITREEGKRTISVSAGVERTYNVAAINTKLLEFSRSIDLPSGYSWKTGGVNEENERSVASIFQAMLVSFMLILVTMVIQFRSYRQAVIVLLVIPLAISSVFFVFALAGIPLSFPALIGVLSLFGIVVTNSMFIVDKINLNIREGMGYVRAIADAGASRMEPIILTKLCTIFGLLPITIADPLWRGLGGAIISGILLASSIMLLFIPVVYYYWMKDTAPEGINT